VWCFRRWRTTPGAGGIWPCACSETTRTFRTTSPPARTRYDQTCLADVGSAFAFIVDCDCANAPQTRGMDYAKINACATGSLGVQLFRESIAYGNAQGIYVHDTTRHAHDTHCAPKLTALSPQRRRRRRRSSTARPTSVDPTTRCRRSAMPTPDLVPSAASRPSSPPDPLARPLVVDDVSSHVVVMCEQ
jgi:hypothetical protein